MDGRPVWLASYSLRDAKGLIPAWQFDDKQIDQAEKVLLEVLFLVGDPKRERFFQMAVTMCMHRAVNDDEFDRLPEKMHHPVGIAGAPAIRVIRETEPGKPSTRPCHDPTKVTLEASEGRPIWIAKDCGICEPCVARIEA